VRPRLFVAHAAEGGDDREVAGAHVMSGGPVDANHAGTAWAFERVRR
jgi:hypothetical protein